MQFDSISQKPPSAVEAKSSPVASSSVDVEGLLDQISKQGDKIRQIKQDKADKKIIEAEVFIMKSIKVY